MAERGMMCMGKYTQNNQPKGGIGILTHIDIIVFQWSFGVTVWEIFTCGKVPYHGISCMALTGVLRRGEHLERPHNKACSAEV